VGVAIHSSPIFAKREALGYVSKSDRIHEVHVAPFKEESGKIVQLLMLFRDITEGKQAEEQLRKNEKQLHNLLQSIQVAVVVHGPDTRIVKCNKKSQALLELTEDQKNMSRIIPKRYSVMAFVRNV
jgi:PAS domain-containing protein